MRFRGLEKYILIAIIIIMPTRSRAVENLLPNADFKQTTGGIPDSWTASQDSSVLSVITADPVNELRISEDSNAYSPALVTTFTIDGLHPAIYSGGDSDDQFSVSVAALATVLLEITPVE